MKILITTDLYTTNTNGVVTSVKNLHDELVQKGHDVRILTFSENTKSYQSDKAYYIKSLPLGVYPDVRMPLLYKSHITKELIEWEPDIIHSQCEFFSFQYALKISRLTGAPIVHTYHTLYEDYVGYVVPVKRMGKFIVKILSRERLKSVKEVIAPTHKVENTLREYGLRNNIKVIPSGINMEQHTQRITAERRAEKRRKLGIGDDKTVLINLGRLGTEKNLGELMDYFYSAHKKHEELVFLIVGDGPAKAELEEKARELQLSGCVIFTGMVKPDEVHEYYQLGDIFVSASTSETQGLTYIEAAANGLPLLCREDLCLEGVLKNGENGYTYTDRTEFMKNAELMLGNKEWLKKAGKRSEEIALSFNKESFGNNIEDIYETVLKSSRKNPRRHILKFYR